jgi:LPS sulfotransferase NodH
MMPQFHIGGMWDTIAAPLLAGGSVICGGQFSRDSFRAHQHAFQPTWTQLVPAMLRELVMGGGAASARPFDPLVESGHFFETSRPGAAVEGSATDLRLIRSVSAPLPHALRVAAEERLRAPVIEIYGMTETAGVITSNPLPPAVRPEGSVGIAAGPTIAIVNDAGLPVPVGQEGEVVVRGPSVARGYLDAAEATADAFRTNGFHTGDLGRIDAAGYLYLTGRLKDMINRGGEKISPAEIDAALLSHPEVADAAAFAIPHPALGEEPAAAVVPATHAGPGLEERLRGALREKLSIFKLPRRIVLVTEIPRTKGGKLQRRRLAEVHAATLAADAPCVPSPSIRPKSPGDDLSDSPLLKLVRQIWADALGCGTVGREDDFFASGGDSLKAAAVVNRLQEHFPGEIIYVTSLYDAPTPAAYELFLMRHHPAIAMRVVGESVAGGAAANRPITEPLFADFRNSIAPSLPPRGVGASARHDATPAANGDNRFYPRDYQRDYPRNPRAVFVLSPPRSGSTLLRAMLAGHPQLFAPPELYLLSYDTMAERRRWFARGHSSQLEGAVRALMQLRNGSAEDSAEQIRQFEEEGRSTRDFYQWLQSLAGQRLLVDKTPNYSVSLDTLRRADEEVEQPLFIHLSRHPYGMIRSFEEANMAQLWWPRLAGPDASSAARECPYTGRQLGELLWLLIHRNIHEFLATIPSHRQHAIAFEQLVADPAESMKSLCRFLEIPYLESLLRPLDNPRSRMTDGVRDISRMIGDPKFHTHRGIEAETADLWKSHYEADFLGEPTWQLAAALGYHETVANAGRRVTLEI